MNSKSYYKYKFGYINIDQENVYLTSTGNWSEIKVLGEKVFGKSSKKIGKVISIYFLLAILLLMTIASFFFNEKIPYAVGTLAVGIAGVHRLKKYFDTETGQRFFIPKNKIIDIVWENDFMTLHFNTLENELDKIVLRNIEGDIEQLKQELKATNS
ncbi:MAG: hypothetical protein V4549_17450 [Bacteroidota bacterium]